MTEITHICVISVGQAVARRGDAAPDGRIGPGRTVRHALGELLGEVVVLRPADEASLAAA